MGFLVDEAFPHHLYSLTLIKVLHHPMATLVSLRFGFIADHGRFIIIWHQFAIRFTPPHIITSFGGMKSKKPKHIACPHTLIMIAPSLLLALSSGSDALLLPASPPRCPRAWDVARGIRGARRLTVPGEECESRTRQRRCIIVIIQTTTVDNTNKAAVVPTRIFHAYVVIAVVVFFIARRRRRRRSTRGRWQTRRNKDGIALAIPQSPSIDGQCRPEEGIGFRAGRVGLGSRGLAVAARTTTMGEEEEGLEEGEEGKDVDPKTMTLTPSDAFGYAATRSLYESLGKMGQKYGSSVRRGHRPPGNGNGNGNGNRDDHVTTKE